MIDLFIGLQSVVVEFGVEFMKIVDLWQPLLSGRCSQELDIVWGIILAESQLVNLLFAA